jgi:hypothetical protein
VKLNLGLGFGSYFVKSPSPNAGLGLRTDPPLLRRPTSQCLNQAFTLTENQYRKKTLRTTAQPTLDMKNWILESSFPPHFLEAFTFVTFWHWVEV